jgi:S-adenosylmethionine/arginine decarboxylase-like enzyme
MATMKSQDLVYGWELILDLFNCHKKATVEYVLKYFEYVCPLLRMKPYKVYFWSADELPTEGVPEIVRGMSAVQFILTSSITVHTSDPYRMVLLNIHSCQRFDPHTAINF